MRLTLLAVSICTAAPVWAQDADPAQPRDTVTVAVGVATTPRYEGSNRSIFSTIAAIRGSVSGVSFSTLGTQLFVDLIPAKSGPNTKFVIGPSARVDLDRASINRIGDRQIAALGKIKPAVELGGHAGLTRTGVITSQYDVLTLDVAATADVTGVNESYEVIPTINYGTPLSRKVFVGINAGATYVGSGYARTYFGVTPAQSGASGLRRYDIGSGFKDVSVGALGNLSLTGDLLHGLSAFGVTNYSRLLGDFGRSPVTRDRNQFFGGLGLAYTF